MKTRTIIKNALGTLALLGAVNSQAALLEYTDAAKFAADLDNLAFPVEKRSEGFEPTAGSPWEPLLTAPQKVVNVPSMGVQWSETNDANLGLGIVKNGGDTHEGLYAMNVAWPSLTTPGITMSYTVNTSGFKLVAFGGWFKDNDAGSKPRLTVDGVWFFEDQPLTTEWQFLGIIDNDPNGGFTEIAVTETEGLDQLEWFYTDAVTFAAQPGQFPAVPIPAALPLFGSALLGLGFIGRRRQKKLS